MLLKVVDAKELCSYVTNDLRKPINVPCYQINVPCQQINVLCQQINVPRQPTNVSCQPIIYQLQPVVYTTVCDDDAVHSDSLNRTKCTNTASRLLVQRSTLTHTQYSLTVDEKPQHDGGRLEQRHGDDEADGVDGADAQDDEAAELQATRQQVPAHVSIQRQHFDRWRVCTDWWVDWFQQDCYPRN